MQDRELPRLIILLFLPIGRFHAQIEIQRQSFVPVLSNTHGFLSSIGVRIILRYLLFAKFMQRQQIPRLAHIESTQAFERRYYIIHKLGR